MSLMNLPDHLLKVSKTWMNVNPSWNYRYSSHNQRLEDIKEYPELLDFYNVSTPAVQSDIWRFIVTYKYGGVYADMDSVCIKPLDYLLDTVNDCEILVVPSSHNELAETNTANYAIKEKSYIMKQILELCKKTVYLPGINHKEPWTCFMETVTQSSDTLYEFTSAWHTMEFKTAFDKNFDIDFYGKKIKYEDFLSQNSLSMI